MLMIEEATLTPSIVDAYRSLMEIIIVLEQAIKAEGEERPQPSEEIYCVVS